MKNTIKNFSKQMKDINTANRIIRDNTMMNKKRETIKMNPA